jgi:Protein of unknown function (DUF3102)
MPENPSQAIFAYETLDEGTRIFVQHKTDEAHVLLKRTAENILAIGLILQEIKQRLPHGHFLPWLQAEFGMSRMTANHFMQVADKFAGKCTNLLHLPATILYELASPSTDESIIEHVERGEIAPTLEAIKEAKAALKVAQEAERQARTTVQTTQQRLFQVQKDNTDLERQIAQLHQQLTTVPEPVVQIQEVEVPVIPAEVTTQLKTLQQHLNEARLQRDQLSQRVTELGAQARVHLIDQNREARGHRIRHQWRQATKEVQQRSLQLLAQWPTHLDIETFDQEEWACLLQLQEITRLIMDACIALEKEVRQVVEANQAG